MSNSFATPWTVAFQAPLSIGFPRQEYWNGLPFPSDPGMELTSPALTGGFFTTERPGKWSYTWVQFTSVAQVSNSLRPHEPQHARSPCPSPTPGVHPNSCPLSRWCHPTISSSIVPFSSCLQSFPASGSFPMSQYFTSGGQSIRVSASASVLPVNIQDWFPLGLTELISLELKGLSRVFSNNTVQKYWFFGAQLSL